MYVDTPNPGWGFVLLNIVFIAVMIFIPSFIIWRGFSYRRILLVLVIIVCFGGLLTFSVILHSLFHTEYTITSTSLILKNGILLRGKYELDTIDEIRLVRFNQQTFGTAFHLRGYCNRFFKGIRIEAGDKVIFISPGDRETFAAELRKRLNF